MRLRRDSQGAEVRREAEDVDMAPMFNQSGVSLIEGARAGGERVTSSQW